MKQVSKKNGGYQIFNCETRVVTVQGDWEFVAFHMKQDPDIYVLDSSVKDLEL
jgi:hypothetical protein